MTARVEAPCRSCGATLRTTFVNLGSMPLANAYPSSVEEAAAEARYPLHAWVCDNCYLVQLVHEVDPSVLFSDYAYFSSYSESWLAHARDFAVRSVERFNLNGDSLVVEVASNDGYLMHPFQELGVQVLGVEPAENVAKVAIDKGIPTDVRFFGTVVAESLKDAGREADLLIGNNVIAHVPDLNDFVGGMATLIKDKGVVSLEFPHLLRLMEEVQFDTIYHEHFSYFSLHALQQVLERHGLHVFDVQRLSTHGGSLRVMADRGHRGTTDGYEAVRKAERDARLDHLKTYEGFAEKVERSKSSLLSFLAEAKARGTDVVAYGAAAKGNTFLNYCGVGPSDIAYVVDRSPHKQERLLPGTHIPIRSPDTVAETRPGFLLILPWNLKDEIIEQMKGIRSWGGRFITAVPEVCEVG